MQRDRTSRQGSPASPGLRSVQSATENAAISLVDRRMNEDVALEPRMKPIQKLPTNGPMCVREPRCITTFVGIAPSAASVDTNPVTPLQSHRHHPVSAIAPQWVTAKSIAPGITPNLLEVAVRKAARRPKRGTD